jgi:hypothetical protein
VEVGVGLLGPAGIGQAHAYTLVRQVLWPPAAVPRLVRVAGRQTVKAELTRARYGFVRAGERWQELIDDPAVQAHLATVLLLSWAEYGHLGRGAALASVLVVFLAAVVLPVERFGRRGPRAGPTVAT